MGPGARALSSAADASLLIDTDVLVDFLKDLGPAVEYLEGIETTPLVSTITAAELYAGARDEAEAESIDRFLLAFELVPIDRRIARQGGLFRRRFGTRHGTGLADALIAATAVLRPARLVTRNRRHFRMLDDLVVPYTP